MHPLLHQFLSNLNLSADEVEELGMIWMLEII